MQLEEHFLNSLVYFLEKKETKHQDLNSPTIIMQELVYLVYANKI